MMKNKWTLISNLLAVALLALSVGPGQARGLGHQGDVGIQADLGTAFTYQGQLRSGGEPVNGACDFQFSLWDASSGGIQVGETQTKINVLVSSGYFTIPDLDFGSNAFPGAARWLAIAVRCPVGSGSYTTLSPRQALTPAPYALALPGLWTQQNAVSPNVIGGYGGNSVTDGRVGATIGGGGASGYVNRVTDNYGTVGGGGGNTASGNATVGGGYQNTASGGDATIGGGWLNTAGGEDATIGGGYANTASNYYATIGGGSSNTASGEYAIVGGGSVNTASGDHATVGGGWGNTAVYTGTTVSGGWMNAASHDYAAVGGGAHNSASGPASTVGGGWSNLASGESASVGGGDYNIAGAAYATIAGGGPSDPNDPTNTNNRVTDNYGAIGGGGENQAGNDDGDPWSAQGATVGGGWVNIARGKAATVPGGASNVAGGAYSFAAGANAQATHDGAFVWSSGEATSSWGDNTFTVRAHGGARFYSASGTGTGVQLPSGGGSWSSLSDRAAKENFAPVDSRDLLERLAVIPIQTWNYRSQDPAIRHIGPVAQDFYAAFGVGEDDTHISTVDADGVALAAIQGLYELSQEQATRIESLEMQNAALLDRLDRLERRIVSLEQNPGNLRFSQNSSLSLPGAALCLLGSGLIYVCFRNHGKKYRLGDES